MFLAVLAALPPAMAQPLMAVVTFIAQVDFTPTETDLPGGEMFQKILNWTGQAALWGSLASLLVGGMVWGVSQNAGNGYRAGQGRNFAVGGAVGALLVGLSTTIVNTLYTG